MRRSLRAGIPDSRPFAPGEFSSLALLAPFTACSPGDGSRRSLRPPRACRRAGVSIHSDSRAVISSMRRWWRPPSKSVVSQTSQDLVGETLGDDPRADRQHVGVVVTPRVLGGVEVVAQRGAHATHLVRRDLLALAAAAEHDPRLRATGSHFLRRHRRRSVGSRPAPPSRCRDRSRRGRRPSALP